MFAVIETGGKQYKVESGLRLRVEKIDAEVGAGVDLDKVLMVVADEGVQIGKPYLEGAHVSATVQEQGRGKKIRIIKFKRRKHFRKQMGHRQSYTELLIGDIVSA
ncbi:MAG: 50S ribosomal protein L21 [Gammaproteobacteria bacterium]|nr:MAG: 50S ribosomal protein L21 [Gammaproteobacteria bacterium]RLA13551.1 MAG: 50S ribosomal protein L21 [Gammaproteobacteria bacterium]RLA15410.1 MAG: 50S ribosomal protein L21 [Gammaproteobacteria bacterium]